jgi:hypothetical protein
MAACHGRLPRDLPGGIEGTAMLCLAPLDLDYGASSEGATQGQLRGRDQGQLRPRGLGRAAPAAEHVGEPPGHGRSMP